jgi:hypothetical protein
MGRLITAFILAPLVTFPVTFLCFSSLFFLQSSNHSVSDWSNLRLFAAMGLVATLWAYGAMLVLGIPATLILRRSGRFSPSVMAAAGAGIGALPFLPSAASHFIQWQRGSAGAATAISSDLTFLVAGSLSGMLAALLVWRLAPAPITARTTLG